MWNIEKYEENKNRKIHSMSETEKNKFLSSDFRSKKKLTKIMNNDKEKIVQSSKIYYFFFCKHLSRIYQYYWMEKPYKTNIHTGDLMHVFFCLLIIDQNCSIYTDNQCDKMDKFHQNTGVIRTKFKKNPILMMTIWLLYWQKKRTLTFNYVNIFDGKQNGIDFESLRWWWWWFSIIDWLRKSKFEWFVCLICSIFFSVGP